MSTVTPTRHSALWLLLQRVEPHEWGGHPACAEHDPELFYPASEKLIHQIERAKSICRTCPIQGSCLQFANQHGEHGIWGGATEEERSRMRQMRPVAS